MRILTPFSISLVAYEWRRSCGVTRRWIPAASAAAAKVSDSTRLLNRCVAVSIGEQPAAVAMGPPQAAEFVEGRLRQRHEPLLVSLATSDTQHLGWLDRWHARPPSAVASSADAQAARAHDSQTRLVNRVADTPEQLPDLILRQRLRQPLFCRGERILFFPNSPHDHDRGGMG